LAADIAIDSNVIDSPELRTHLRAEFERHARNCPAQADLAADYIALLGDPLAFSR